MSFRSILAEVYRLPLYRHVTARLWRRCLSIRSQFCDAVVASGLLTWEQMLSAACRYCVGATRKGGVIFWQIDKDGRVHDGKVMYYQRDCHRYKDNEASQAVMQSVFWEDSPPIHVSAFLELNATPEQKRRKIDLLDYIMEVNSE